MNTFQELRAHLNSEFSTNPNFTLDSSELTNLGSGILNGNGLDPALLQRIRFLLADDRDDRFICFNSEAVVFGILSSGGRRYLAKDSDIQKFMRDHGFNQSDSTNCTGDFHVSRERKNKYIDRSHLPPG